MDALEVFGLTVLLEDKTSATADRITKSLQTLGINVHDVEKQVYSSFQRMESVMHSGFQINIWGGRIQTIGKSVVGVFKEVSQAVMQTGGDFETQRMKLESLYESAAKGEEVFQYAVNSALKTPFSVQEYVNAVAGLKVTGIDPLQKFMSQKNNKMQDFVTFAGDLAAAFGKKMDDAFFSLKEAVAEDSWVSLKRRFSGLSKQTVEAATGMTLATGVSAQAIEQRMTVMAKFIGTKYGGLMDKLGGTFSGLVSRAKENLSVLLMYIGDSGFFKYFKSQMESIIQFIEGNGEKLKVFAKVVSDSLIAISKPIAATLKLAMRFIDVFVDFSNAHPKLARVIAISSMLAGSLTVVLGVVVALSGSLVTMIASLATLALNMRMSHGSTKLSAMVFQGFGKIIISLAKNLVKLSLATALVTTIWKNDLGGLRSKFVSFTNNLKQAYTQFTAITKLNFNDFLSNIVVLKQTDSALSKLTLKMLKAYYVTSAFFDYLEDGKVSKDSVLRLQQLGVLGFLESLIKVEIAVRSVINGVGKYFAGAWNTIKPILDWFYNRAMDIVTLWAKIMNKNPSEISLGQGGFVGKELNGKFEALGKVLGFVLANAIAMRVGKVISNIAGGVIRLNHLAKTSYVAARGYNLNDKGEMEIRVPRKLGGRGRYSGSTPDFHGYHTQYRKPGWRDLLVNFWGTKEEKAIEGVKRLKETQRKHFDWLHTKRKEGEQLSRKEADHYRKAFNRGRGGAVGKASNSLLKTFVADFSRLPVLFARRARGMPIGWGRKGGQLSDTELMKKYRLDNLAKGIHRLATNARSGFTKLIGYVRNPMSLVNELKQMGTRMSNGIRNLTTATLSKARTATSSAASTVFGSIFGNKYGQAVLNGMRPFLTPLATLVGAAFSNPIKSAIVGLIALFVGLMEDNPIAKGIFSVLLDGVAALGATLTFLFVDVLPRVFDVAFKTLGAVITYSIKTAIPGLGRGAKEAYNATMNEADAIKKQLSDGVAKFADNLFGSNAVNNWNSNIRDPVLQVPEDFRRDLNWLRQTTGINPPPEKPPAPVKQEVSLLNTKSPYSIGFYKDVVDLIMGGKPEDTSVVDTMVAMDKNVSSRLDTLPDSLGKKYEDVSTKQNSMITNGLSNLGRSLSIFSSSFASDFASASSNLWSRIASGFSGSQKATPVDGSHSSGLPYVPFDGYTAKLHKGETVKTAVASNQERRRNKLMQLTWVSMAESLKSFARQDVGSPVQTLVTSPTGLNRRRPTSQPNVSPVISPIINLTSPPTETAGVQPVVNTVIPFPVVASGTNAVPSTPNFNLPPSRNEQSSTKTSGGSQISVVNHFDVSAKIELPNVKDASPDDLVKALKDPAVVKQLQIALAKAHEEESLRRRESTKSNWGVS